MASDYRLQGTAGPLSLCLQQRTLVRRSFPNDVLPSNRVGCRRRWVRSTEPGQTMPGYLSGGVSLRHCLAVHSTSALDRALYVFDTDVHKQLPPCPSELCSPLATLHPRSRSTLRKPTGTPPTNHRSRAVQPFRIVVSPIRRQRKPYTCTFAILLDRSRKTYISMHPSPSGNMEIIYSECVLARH